MPADVEEEGYSSEEEGLLVLVELVETGTEGEVVEEKQKEEGYQEEWASIHLLHGVADH